MLKLANIIIIIIKRFWPFWNVTFIIIKEFCGDTEFIIAFFSPKLYGCVRVYHDFKNQYDQRTTFCSETQILTNFSQFYTDFRGFTGPDWCPISIESISLVGSKFKTTKYGISLVFVAWLARMKSQLFYHDHTFCHNLYKC